MKKIERKKKKDDKQRKLLYIYIFFVSCYVRNFIENDQNKHRNILQKMFLSLYFVSLMNMIITFNGYSNISSFIMRLLLRFICVNELKQVWKMIINRLTFPFYVHSWRSVCCSKKNSCTSCCFIS